MTAAFFLAYSHALAHLAIFGVILLIACRFASGCIRHRSKHRNHVWSYDFVMDRTEDGRQLAVACWL
jgi:hypothetical protein